MSRMGENKREGPPATPSTKEKKSKKLGVRGQEQLGAGEDTWGDKKPTGTSMLERTGNSN